MIADFLEVANKLGVTVLPFNNPSKFGDIACFRLDGQPEVRVQLDNNFYVAYRIDDEHLKDEAACYMVPSLHSLKRGFGRVVRGRVLNVVASPTAFESRLGEAVGEYPAGHLESVAIRAPRGWDAIDSVIAIDGVRYTVIESLFDYDIGMSRVWLDSPVAAPIKSGASVHGGLLTNVGVSIAAGGVGVVSAPIDKQSHPGVREQVSKDGFHFETTRNRLGGRTDVYHQLLMGVVVIDPTKCTLVENPATPAGLYF